MSSSSSIPPTECKCLLPLRILTPPRFRMGTHGGEGGVSYNSLHDTPTIGAVFVDLSLRSRVTWCYCGVSCNGDSAGEWPQRRGGWVRVRSLWGYSTTQRGVSINNVNIREELENEVRSREELAFLQVEFADMEGQMQQLMK
ncbi:hypothetical protein Tco_0873553 [Tanacetum coccineum]|uniref:Uncharacterized protein n=1 Tax=Tanacetum coccineum TaxID=301880 RepID=A0ABQ5BM31_9ASTR